mmetsp:Transcript_54751/g.108688  ORF Transcript_54751/g.108688 Transcript_54751/m.108688 type:complete len:208 (+) Transcript_54751:903-1526(+)
MAICTRPFESWSAPLVSKGMKPVAFWPGAICGGKAWPSAAGLSGLRPKEFLLNWMAKPERGPMVPFSIVICRPSWPFCFVIAERICMPSPRSAGSVTLSVGAAGAAGAPPPKISSRPPIPPMPPPMPPAAGGGVGAAGSSSIKPPSRSTCGGGGAGASPWAPPADPSAIMSEVIAEPSSSSSSRSTAPPPMTGTSRLPEMKVEGGLW